MNYVVIFRKRRLKYLRKVEVMETRERVIERRMVLNLIKAKYKTCLVDDVCGDKPDKLNVTTPTSQLYVTTNDQGVVHL